MFLRDLLHPTLQKADLSQHMRDNPLQLEPLLMEEHRLCHIQHMTGDPHRLVLPPEMTNL